MGHPTAERRGKLTGPPSDEDWRRAAAAIARYMPGLGDPMDMTLPELEAWTIEAARILQRENGTEGEPDHRARVEAEMRRIHG